MSRLVILCFFMSVFVSDTIPQKSPRFVAEWEPAWGTLIRWPLGIPSSLVVELTVDDSLYVLVESPYERDQAIASFSSWGVNLDYCRFIFAPTYSHWTRDWGPHYVFDGEGNGGIADPVFDGYPWVPGCNSEKNVGNIGAGNKNLLGYEEDDAVNIILADSFQCPLIPLPVYLTGGNIMVDGMGTAISTQQMLDENIPLAGSGEFFEILNDSAGISNYIIVDNPEVHGIQHIDCYAKFLDETRILVKQVDQNHPEYACCEALADDLGSRLNAWGEPYEILRIYCGSFNGDEVAAYTNSLLLNKKVLVPMFGIESDALALQTYLNAMPGYNVVGFEWDGWYYYDALHCRAMGIFDRHMLRLVHKPLKGDVIFYQDPNISVYIDDRSEAGLDPDQLLLYWRLSGTYGWNTEVLESTMHPDTFATFIPDPVIGSTYDYYISAADSTDRTQTLPLTAPSAYYSFTLEYIVTSNIPKEKNEVLQVQPSVFNSKTNILIPPTAQPAQLIILTTDGKIVLNRPFPPDNQSRTILWDVSNTEGMQPSPGMYFIRLKSGSGIHTIKCLMTR